MMKVMRVMKKRTKILFQMRIGLVKRFIHIVIKANQMTSKCTLNNNINRIDSRSRKKTQRAT